MVDLEQAARHIEQLLDRADVGLDEAEECGRMWPTLDAVDRDEFLIEWPVTNDVLMRLAALSNAGRLTGVQIERYGLIRERRRKLDPVFARMHTVPAESRV